MKCLLGKTALRSAIALSATTLFVCVLTMATAHAQELVVDGGFENPRKFDSLWNPAENWIACSDVEVTDDEAHSGNYSAKITAHDSSNCNFAYPSYAGIQQYIKPTENTDYIMTFWIKGDIPDRTDGEVEATPPNGGNDISLGIDSQNDNPPIEPDDGEFIIIPKTYNNWTKVEYYWNSGRNNSEFSIDIGSYTNEGGVYYLDDFSVVPAGSSGSDLGTGLLTDYSSGLWFYTNSDWEKLSNNDAEYMVGFDGGIAADFGSEGLQVYDGTSWDRIGSSPDNSGNTMVAFNSGLAVDYGSSGLYFYQNGDWDKLSGSDPEYLAVFEGKLAVDFGDGTGLWVWDGSWDKLGSTTDDNSNRMVGID